MVYLVIKGPFDQAYELTDRASAPRSSPARRYRSDAYTTFRFVAGLPLAPQQWVQILRSTHHHLTNFHSNHPGEVYQAVTESVMHGDLAIYQLPNISETSALRGKHGVGLSIIRGPHLHSATDLTSEPITNPDDAKRLLDELGISEKALLAYLNSENLYNSYQQQNPLADALNLLATGELLVYKISLPASAPTPKAVEYLPTMAADKPVPLAPETKPPTVIVHSEQTEKSAPQSLDDCQQCLIDARKKLDSEGYKPKYTDAQQLQKVKENSVSKERFLVSFQTENTYPDAKLAFQRDSGLAPVWATSFDQLENADTDPQLIADILGTPYDPSKDYVLHIIDRGEDGTQFGQNTLVPTWDNMQEPTQKYLGGKHDPAVLAEVMTPEYQTQYAEDIENYHSIGLKEFDKNDQKEYSEILSSEDRKKFLARHNVRTEIGANSEFTGNGLTQSREGSTNYGVVETLTLKNNPPPISKMGNVKTINLKPRVVV